MSTSGVHIQICCSSKPCLSLKATSCAKQNINKNNTTTKTQCIRQFKTTQWAHFKNSLLISYNQCLILEARIMNKNAEQTSTWGSSWIVFFWFSFLIFIRPIIQSSINKRFLLFSWCIMARCREHRQGETFKTHLPYKYPLQHNHKKN